MNFSHYGCHVKELGAIGDGINDDGEAIQRALDARQGLVIIPAGHYKIGRTLRIPSGTRVQAHPLARLFMANGAGVDMNSFLLSNANPDSGDENIHVEGGVWDGNNPGNPRGPDAPSSYTGVALNFINVSGLSLRRLTVRDSESYFIRLGEVQNFEVTQIRFEAPHVRPNQDGVHVGGLCQRGVIRDLHAVGASTTNDDLVPLLADDALHRAQNLGLKCGPIRHIRIEGLRAHSCHSFVRLLSVVSPISDIQIEDLQGGCRHCALNLDACRECRVTLFDPGDPQFQNGVGDIFRVTVRDLHVYKASLTDTHPLFDLRTNVDDFTIADVKRDVANDVNPTVNTFTMTDIQPSHVSLEGLAEVQLGALRASQDLNHEIIQRLATLSETPRYRGKFTLKQQGTLNLSHGGFDMLWIMRAQ